MSRDLVSDDGNKNNKINKVNSKVYPSQSRGISANDSLLRASQLVGYLSLEKWPLFIYSHFQLTMKVGLGIQLN